MLSALHNILGVARYECKMLLRTTKFRILGGLTVCIYVCLGINFALGFWNKAHKGLEGYESYVLFLVYTTFQALVIPFLAGSFRTADENAHIYEVVAGRPISTAALVVGKYLGTVSAFFFFSLSVLILALSIQAAEISMADNPFTIEPYLLYLLLLNFPTLIFLSSLTFFLGVLLRRPIAAALIVTTYSFAAILFFSGSQYFNVGFDFLGLDDYMGYSDLMGIGNITQVGLQRLFYVLLGIGFLGLAIDRYPRLAHSMNAQWFGRGCALTGFGLTTGLYFFFHADVQNRQTYRQSLLAQQEAVAHIPVTEITHYDLAVTLLGKDLLSASGKIILKNNLEVPLDTLILSLNPGLKIQSLMQDNGSNIEWDRTGSVIRVMPDAPLLSDQELGLKLNYAGDIDTDGFDLKREKGKSRFLPGRMGMGFLTAWIRDNSIFLPPRSRWYPVTGVDYGYKHARPASFSTANLHITFPQGLEIITQGQIGKTDTLGTQVIRQWVVENPVPVLSLNAGVYCVYRATIHDIECALYVHPSHLRLIRFFEDAEEEVVRALGQIVDMMEQESGMKYPYPNLSLVEIPFHIQWYYEGWEEKGGLTLPGVLMIEEKVLARQSFTHIYKPYQQQLSVNREPKNLKKDLLVRAVLETFFAEESANSGLFRSPVFQLWAYDKNFVGDHYALLKKGMPLYLQSNLRNDMASAFFSRRRQRSGVSRGSSKDWNRLTAKMQRKSFADLDPEQEAKLYRQVLDVKGPGLFEMMASFLGEETFRTLISDINQNYKYKDIDFSTFERAAVGYTEDEDRLRLQRLVKDWIFSTEIPGYTLTSVKALKIDDGSGILAYQLIVRIKNSEPGRGYVQITALSENDEAIKGVEIESGQEIEVSMVLWEQPLRVIIEPFFARNRQPLISPVRVPEQVTKGAPIAYLKDVTGEEDMTHADTDPIEIIVDNDDKGFSMPIHRVTRFSRPGLKGGNWRERSLPVAYGRYAKNYRQKKPGDGAQPAVWTAQIPRDGEFDVSFYFPDQATAKREGIAPAFTLTVFHAGKVDTLKMERDLMKAGWNHLGRYKFVNREEAVVELSDRAEGVLYADAVRWRFVDKLIPQQAFFDPQNPGAHR